MDEINSWLLKETVQVILSGAMGGVVRWLTLKERASSGIVSIIVGAICAVYLGPLVQPILAPFIQVVLTEQVSRASFTGFIVGIGGISISGFIIDVIRARREEAKAKLPKSDLDVLGAKLKELYAEIEEAQKTAETKP